jgi:hypothetical protein
MLAYYILLPIGLLLLAISVGVGTYQHWFIKHSVLTEGRVIGNVRKGRGYSPKIEIRTNEGKEIIFTPAGSSNPPIYNEGDKVPVVYQGEDARIFSFGFRFGLPWAFLCVGVAMVVIAFGFKYGDWIMNSFYGASRITP